MANKDNGLRVCPTRIDGSPVLFAHKVDKPRCQERQRQRYHKCFTCAYNNNYVDKNGLPAKQTAVVEEEPATSKVG
jgi:hypothetical protein